MLLSSINTYLYKMILSELRYLTVCYCPPLMHIVQVSINGGGQ
jgi:hypothetical protein